MMQTHPQKTIAENGVQFSISGSDFDSLEKLTEVSFLPEKRMQIQRFLEILISNELIFKRHAPKVKEIIKFLKIQHNAANKILQLCEAKAFHAGDDTTQDIANCARGELFGCFILPPDNFEYETLAIALQQYLKRLDIAISSAVSRLKNEPKGGPKALEWRTDIWSNLVDIFSESGGTKKAVPAFLEKLQKLLPDICSDKRTPPQSLLRRIKRHKQKT